MAALVCFPDSPPFCELANSGAWEGRERVEWGETIRCDRECENEKVCGEREEGGEEWGGKIWEKKDGPKRRDREYDGQDRLGRFWFAPVEDEMGELWEKV